MTYTHLIRSLALTLLIVPMSAMAYMTPEEVLTSEENARFFEPPPSQRDTRAIADQQASSAAARRAAEQAALFGSSSSASADDELHGAAPDNSDTTTNMDDGSSDTSGLSTADQRALERLKEHQLELMIQEQAKVLASQQSLHGGAPLADSGPGTIVAIATLAGAGLWTILRARKMEKAN